MATQSYRDLIAWQRAIEVVEHTYRITREWPKEEMYGLTQQVRRAAVSVPANIAEGQGRNNPKEFVHFLGIAHGSLREVETYLVIASRLQFSDEHTNRDLMDKADEVGKLLRGLIRSIHQ